MSKSKENDEVVRFVKNGGKLEIPPNSPSKLYAFII